MGVVGLGQRRIATACGLTGYAAFGYDGARQSAPLVLPCDGQQRSIRRVNATPSQSQTLTPQPVRRRRGGCLLRGLLVLGLLAGGGAGVLKLFGNTLLPPVVDAARGVIGAEGMAEVEARYYGLVEETHRWQRQMGWAPAAKAPWTVAATPVADAPVADGGHTEALPPDLSPQPAAGLEPIAAAPTMERPDVPPSAPLRPSPTTPAPPATSVALIDLLPSALPALPTARATLRLPRATPTVLRPRNSPTAARPSATRPPPPPLPTWPPTAIAGVPPLDWPPTADAGVPLIDWPPTAVAGLPPLEWPPTALILDATPVPPPPPAANFPPAVGNLPPLAPAHPPSTSRNPPAVAPLVQDGALPGEGLWTSEGLPQPPGGGAPAFWKTFLRPNPERPDALVYLVRFDPQRLQLHMVAGTQEPVSPLGLSGPGQIAPGDVPALAAAFNGGWKSVHGNYGMMVGGQTIAPPNTRPDTATLAQHADGRLELAAWKTLSGATDLVSYRQNCPLLIDNGAIAVQGHISSTWGLSLLSEMYVWRSGVGQTADGALIYAAGTPVAAEELAAALQAAGATTAMQLDINSAWVHWVDYLPAATGAPRAEPLVPDMAYSRNQYLTPTERDFFYLTWR